MQNRVFDLTILDHNVELVISDDVQDTDLDLRYDFGGEPEPAIGTSPGVTVNGWSGIGYL